MAKALKCDLCGNLYNIYDGIKYDEHGNSYNTIVMVNDSIAKRSFDVCPECMHVMIRVMRSRKMKGVN